MRKYLHLFLIGLIFLLLSAPSCPQKGVTPSSPTADGLGLPEETDVGGADTDTDTGTDVPDITDIIEGEFVNPDDLAHLPVTIAKLKLPPNALRTWGRVTGRDKEKDKDVEVEIKGLPDAANPGETVAFSNKDTNEILQTATVNEDGSFDVTLDSDTISKPINVSYYDEEANELGFPITAVVHNETNYQVMIYDRPGLVNENVTIYGGDVVYNYAMDDGTFEIRSQKLSGGDATLFAKVNQSIAKLKNAPIVSLKPKADMTEQELEELRDMDYDKTYYVIGVDGNNKIVRIDSKGNIFRLSDENTLKNVKDVNFSIQPKTDGFILAQAIDLSTNLATPYYLIPSISIDPDIPDDLVMRRFYDEPTISMETIWRNKTGAISLSQHPVLVEGEIQAGEFQYAINNYSFYRADRYVLEDFQRKNAEGDNREGAAGNMLLRTEIPISWPVPGYEFTGSLTVSEESGATKLTRLSKGGTYFFIFECVIENIRQICRNDWGTQEVIPMTSTPGDKSQPSLSNDWIAFSQKNEDGSQHVMVLHIPTGNIIPITANTELLEAKDTYRHNVRQTFARDSQYVLFYLSGHDGVRFFPSVIDLRNFEPTGQYIPGSSFCDPGKLPHLDPETACLIGGGSFELITIDGSGSEEGEEGELLEEVIELKSVK